MIALFACVIIGHQLIMFLVRRRFDPLNVKTLIDIVLLAMWVYAPFINSSLRIKLEHNQWFAITSLLGILFLYAGLHLPLRKRQPSMQPQSNKAILPIGWRWLALLLFLVATLIVTLQGIQYRGEGLLGYLSGQRLSVARAFLNEGYEGDIASRVISITHPIMLLWLAIEFNKKRWKKSLMLYLTLLASVVMIATTRLPIIITLLMPLYGYYRVRKRPMSIHVAVIVAICFVFLMYGMNIWRSAGGTSLNDIDISPHNLFHSSVANFGPMVGYEKLWDIYEAGHIPYEYGLTYFYVPLTAVPRSLWKNKPFTAFESRWTYNLFGQLYSMSDEGWGVWTFTVWGEGLVQFGVYGVFLNLFLYGSLVSWAEARFAQKTIFSFVWFYYSILAATYLRSSLSALAFTLMMTFLPIIFIAYLSVRLSKNYSKANYLSIVKSNGK